MRRLVAALAVAALIVLAAASPAAAHTSYYCGHRQVGVWTTVTFLRHYTSPISGRHIHVTEHRRLDIYKIHGNRAHSCNH